MCLDVAGHAEGIIVGIARHADDQIDGRGGEYTARLLGGTDLGERWRVAHTELHILIEDFLIDTPVVLEHESIVGIGDNKDIEDTVGHQIDERHVLQIELAEFLGNDIFHVLVGR